MSDFLKLGERGEALAWNFLKKMGYAILEKNYRTRFGEIDVIAVKDDSLIFIEIKTRRNHHFGLPAEAVDWRKRQKMIRVAESYLQQKKMENREARFDILSITWDGTTEPHFEILDNAFSLEEK